MFSSSLEFVQRHWLALAVAAPILLFAAWITVLVVPEVVKVVVPSVVRAVTGS